MSKIVRRAGPLFLLAWSAAPAAAIDDGGASADFLARYAPPAIDAPALRLPEPMTRLYIDAGYGRSADLSALPFIQGSGHNVFFALGGSLRWRRFSFDAELPSSQSTTLDITQVPTPNGPQEPIAQDRHQTATSIGDLRLGTTWTRPLPVESLYLVAGFGVRLRVPTHTTVFQFHLADGSLGEYRFPYYFHVEPTFILGGTLGPLAFVVNEGLLLLTGPNGDFEGVYIVVPNILFWSAHYAVVYSPWRVLGLSVDLGTDIQLNHVDVVDFMQLNNVVAASLTTGLQIHLGEYRIDLAGRFGLTHDAVLFGVLQYAGTQSVNLRVSRRFN